MNTIRRADPFSFALNTRIWFGVGVRHLLAPFLTERNWHRIAVVADPAFTGNPVGQALLDELSRVTTRCELIPAPTHEPTYDDLEERRAVLRDGEFDAVVGLGGGSTLDTAKGLAVLVHNTGPALSYRGFERMTAPVVPIVALPTTAGSGSEVTPNASFVDAAAKRKMGINGEAVRPTAAFVDPELTLSCPALPTASAGMDAVVHATEAFIARKSNPLARLFAARAVRLLLQHLPNATKTPQSLPDREAVQLGSLLAAIALMNAGTGVASALSYPLGTEFGVAHGLAGGLFLPYVIAYNLGQDVGAYADLFAEAFGERSPEAGDRYLLLIREAWNHLRVPTTLRELGLAASVVDTLVQGALQQTGALEQNPIRIDDSGLRRIVQSAL